MKAEYLKPDSLLALYDELMPRLALAETLLELGVRDGESMRMWRVRLPATGIVGIDINPSPRIDGVTTFVAAQQDTSALTRISSDCAPGGWDVVIDDASHLGTYTRTAFRHLYQHHLRPGGLYIIEDWRTGYDPAWPDGAGLAPRNGDDPSPRRVAVVAAARRAARQAAAHLDDSSALWRAGASAFARIQALDVAAEHPSHAAGMVGVVKEILDGVGAQESPLHVARVTATPHAVVVEKPSG